MAKERDYAKESALAKKRGDKTIYVITKQQVFDDFTAQCAKNGSNKNAVLRRYIERYTYENFDQ